MGEESLNQRSVHLPLRPRHQPPCFPKKTHKQAKDAGRVWSAFAEGSGKSNLRLARESELFRKLASFRPEKHKMSPV